MFALLKTRRIVWALALFVATLALTFSYLSGRSYLTAVGWVEHTLKIGKSLETLIASLRAQESDSRGFIVSGDAVFLENLEREQADFESSVGELRTLLSNNPEQHARLARLEGVAQEKLAFMADSVALRKRGAAAEASARVQSRRGKVLMDRIRGIVSEMEAEERRLLAERSAHAKRRQRETVLAIVAGAAVMLVLLAGSFLVMRRDTEVLRRASEELAESEERYRVLVENAHELVRLHGADGHPFFVSPSSEALLGHTPDECIAARPYAFVHPDDVGLAKYTLGRLQMGELRTGMVTYRLRRRDGEYRWFEFNFARVDGPDGELRHYQSAGRDVTVRRHLEQRLAEQTEELRNLSLRDGLTGLYNRRGLLELSAQVVRVAERERHGLAVLFVDLDGLKSINDRLGHDRGDRAIVEAGELLRTTCRATDLVARLGGDEFVVLAGNVDDGSIEVLKQRIAAAVAQANAAPGRDYQISFSLGVARFDPSSPVPIETLITEADALMYEVKARRRPAAATAAERNGTV
jgi:diguanylate cyclase (GGDEF)-like protein/PAS domain S-box-containing protein